jgi:hypothetical protein
MKTPIAFIIFNRPDNTKKVFEIIRQAQPSRLLVIADGPRANRPDDIEKCAATRAVIDQVDWDCEVTKNFSDKNLGCGTRVSSGITWVFDQVEEAIILEDDCIPHPTFFRYCEELLERYRFDSRVMHISGSNFWATKHPREQSYLFSHYSQMWGWASWRRAWQHYDFQMKQWPEVKQKNLLKDLLIDQHAADTWTKIFQNVVDGGVDTWDYQWHFACWLQHGLAIVPNVNLVSNIGFDEDATHTFTPKSFSSDADAPQLSVPATEIGFPLTHPQMMVRDSEIDQFIQDFYYDYYPKLFKRIRIKLKKIMG